MACAVKPKKSQPDDTTSDNTIKSAELNNCNQSEPSTSYEVFRNNTTAVEVIVKEVMNKSKKKMLLEPNVSLQTIRRFRQEIDSLQYQLATTKSMLLKNRNGYRLIILELKKQLDTLNHQESVRQKENMTLLLENEKLKSLLELKTSLITKLKREFNTMKKVLKHVIKNITCLPQISEHVISSDPEFEDFERDLKKDIDVKYIPNVFTKMGMTFDSTMSKDTKDSFDKHF